MSITKIIFMKNPIQPFLDIVKKITNANAKLLNDVQRKLNNLITRQSNRSDYFPMVEADQYGDHALKYLMNKAAKENVDFVAIAPFERLSMRQGYKAGNERFYGYANGKGINVRGTSVMANVMKKAAKFYDSKAERIKLSLSDPKKPYKQEMSNEEIEAVARITKMLNIKVASHTSGGSAITKAVECGLHSVEHGHWLDNKTVDLMKKNNTFYVPTLLVNERNFDFKENEKFKSSKNWKWLELSRMAKWVSLTKAIKSNIKIATGTDAGFMLPHGEMNYRELEYLVQGGMTNMEAIISATRIGGELLGINVGTIEEGQRADILVIKGDPSKNIKILSDKKNIKVFKDGKLLENSI